jgi:hypothetical protein
MARRVARCEVAAPPCGLEWRLYGRCAFLRAKAFREADALKLEGPRAWLEAFGATGWTVTEN